MEAIDDQDLSGVLRDYLAVAERLQKTHQTLENEIQRLRRELKRKDRELDRRRRLAALGEVAAGVAHEVRNPLGAIQLYSSLLKKECLQHGSALRLIEKIEAGIQSIECVVQSTLSLAPNRACRFHLAPLKDVIERAVDVSVDAYQRQQVALKTDLAPDCPQVRCDEDALQRAVVNILVNAAQASPPGGVVTLSLRTSGAGLRGGSGNVKIRVRDQGPGFPEAARDKMFDPFFTTKEKGTGLGLSVAHRLVDAHGGRLTARNCPGGGAEFTISLPIGAAGDQGEGAVFDDGGAGPQEVEVA